MNSLKEQERAINFFYNYSDGFSEYATKGKNTSA
jgi:hypothetical protein